jgi:hypothetical protein
MTGSARYWRAIPQRYRYEAAKCDGCGEVYFPPRLVCRQCKGRKFTKTVLAQTGQVECREAEQRLAGRRCRRSARLVPSRWTGCAAPAAGQHLQSVVRTSAPGRSSRSARTKAPGRRSPTSPALPASSDALGSPKPPRAGCSKWVMKSSEVRPIAPTVLARGTSRPRPGAVHEQVAALSRDCP